MKLTIELVPKTAWFKNLRSELTRDQWDKIRKDSYKSARYLCQCCGGQGDRHPVECHEVWHYNDETKTQRLDGVVSLCPSCHEVKHTGLASVNGRLKEVTTHLAKVNKWDIHTAKHYIGQSFAKYRERSKHSWTLDVSWLDKTNKNKG